MIGAQTRKTGEFSNGAFGEDTFGTQNAAIRPKRRSHRVFGAAKRVNQTFLVLSELHLSKFDGHPIYSAV